ncbi:MAG TPA: [citrate (pro-3S)-lyase] ligase, partial [Candidatus Pelethomonas intestinigallinarum]|nr:[citrate (pro-3S)-lyase] ligase [Candidatus Pelethomonas intestinigallinarum]
AIFLKIARALGIRRRYVGEEPASVVTGIYNDVLTRELPKAGVECVVIPRKAGPDGKPISASTVRQALQQGDFAALDTLVPPATLDYFRDPEAQPVLERIRSAGDVVHY